MAAHGYDDPCECSCGKRYCASNRQSVENGRRADPSMPYSKHRKMKIRKATEEAERKQQAESLEGAERRWQPWVGWELDLLEREDITRVEIARLTGRTLEAVKHARKKLHSDPRWQRVQDMHLKGGAR